MPGDPFKVFAAGEDWQRSSLKTVWPDLHRVLAREDVPKRAWGCALPGHERGGGDRDYVPVAGRMTLNGTPACAQHLLRSRRKGGYPMDLIDPREWRD